MLRRRPSKLPFAAPANSVGGLRSAMRDRTNLGFWHFSDAESDCRCSAFFAALRPTSSKRSIVVGDLTRSETLVAPQTDPKGIERNRADDGMHVDLVVLLNLMRQQAYVADYPTQSVCNLSGHYESPPSRFAHQSRLELHLRFDCHCLKQFQ